MEYVVATEKLDKRPTFDKKVQVIDAANQVAGQPTLIDPLSVLGLYHETSFTDEGTTFPTLGHYVAYEINEEPGEVLKQKRPLLYGILGSTSPDNLLSVLINGVRLLVGQHRELKKILSETKGTIGYADQYDRVFGIGLAKSDPRAMNQLAWTGRNLHGWALTLVRAELNGEKMKRPAIEPHSIVLPTNYEQPPVEGNGIPTEEVVVEQPIDPQILRFRELYQKDGGFRPWKELTEGERKNLPLQANRIGIKNNGKSTSELYTKFILVLQRGTLEQPPITEAVHKLQEKYRLVKGRGYKKYQRTFLNLKQEANELGLDVKDKNDPETYNLIIEELQKYQ